MFHCDVVDVAKDKITLEKAQQFIESHKCGASLFFVGTVRDNNNNNYSNIVKNSAFCNEKNEIVHDDYLVSKEQKLCIIPPIGGG